MTRIERFLADDEEIDLLTRRHPVVLMRPLLRFALVTALVVTVAILYSPSENGDWVDRAAGVVAAVFFLPVLLGFLRWGSRRWQSRSDASLPSPDRSGAR